MGEKTLKPQNLLKCCLFHFSWSLFFLLHFSHTLLSVSKSESWFCWRTWDIISVTDSFPTSSSFVIFITWDISHARYSTFCVRAHKNPSHQLPQSEICCRWSRWCMWWQGREGMAKAARDKSHAKQLQWKDGRMPGPSISLSTPLILKMLQKYRDIFKSRIVPCLCLFLSELTGHWVRRTEVQSTWCSDSSQMKCVLWQDFCFWIIIHHKEWLSVRSSWLF